MITEKVLGRAFDSREKYFLLKDDNCFRLFNTGGDGLEGVTIDLYGEYILIQFYRQESVRGLENVLDFIYQYLQKRNLNIKGILLKDRRRGSEPGGPDCDSETLLLRGSYPPLDYTVLHNGVLVSVDLKGGQNTGLFFDMREVRENLTDYYPQGGSLLNLFSYTGIFSIHAIKKGISKAINVDISGSVLRRAEYNYGLNFLKTDSRDFVKEDAVKYIKYLVKKGVSFDFVIFDPPSFARSKKSSFSVQRDYSDLLGLISLICPGGYILTAVNSHSVSQRDYLRFHPREWENIFSMNEAGDFPHSGSAYLKTGLWKVN